MSELYLVSCVGQKNPGPAPAKDLYTGTWFSYARCYVEKLGHPWLLLSAKHGVVDPDEMREVYDFSFKSGEGATVAYRRAWAARVFSQLEPHLTEVDSVTFLAGRHYYEGLVEPLRQRGKRISIPMEHLRIGEQYRWLKGKCRGTHFIWKDKPVSK